MARAASGTNRHDYLAQPLSKTTSKEQSHDPSSDVRWIWLSSS